MRSILGFGLLAVAFGVGSGVASVAEGQGSCTGLCLQQVSCPNGGTTTISGTVYAPNGADPLPNVLVFVPNATPAPFTAGVSCPAAGAPPSGSPLVGTTTAVDGTFTLTNVPVGSNIPLVIQSGRWRRQLVVPTTTACSNTDFSARMPRNHNEGDIPKFAIVTGLADQVECVLLKMQVDPAEFQDPGGSGRIDLYLGNDGIFLGQGGPGASYSAKTPTESSLMEYPAKLNQYDVLMLPCQGVPYNKSDAELNDYVAFANAGGRVYSSHYGYVYMDGDLYNDPNVNLPPVANWSPSLGFTDFTLQTSGIATVDTSFAQGDTLAQWLKDVAATTTDGQIPLNTLRHDMTGVIPPTQSWLALNDPADGNPVMQFVYDTPVGGQNQCGRVLFNEYHVETDLQNSAQNPLTFPNECTAGTQLNPQEKLLEYMLFELTNDGGQPTLSPASANFGSETLGFTTAPQTFTWTNNSTFSASATTEITSGFNVVSNNCQNVQGGSSCQIAVNFQPNTLGAQTGTLTVNSSGPSITAALSGIGTPDLNFSGAGLQFGNHDVGSSTTQTITVTDAASGTVPVPAITTTGDYAATTTCGSTLTFGASCTISVIFTPTATGNRPGTMTVGVNVPTQLDGNGVDFSLAISPGSGKVESGLSVSSDSTATPIAGFNNGITLTCTTTAPAATCVLTSGSFGLSSPVQTGFTVSTVSEYTVIGYSGMGGSGWLWLAGAGSGLLLLLRRRTAGRLLRGSTLVAALALLLAGGSAGLSGCSGKLPAKNASYTPGGDYTVTLSATDGFLVHTATYSLDVTSP